MDKLEPIRRVFLSAGLYNLAADDLLCQELAAVAAPQPQPQPVVEPVLPTITAEEAREFQRWKGMDGATAYHLIERHADGWADVGVMMNAWLEANAAKPPAEPEKNCWTCKHASKDAGAAPCNGCSVAEAWDKWEPAAPQPQPSPQASAEDVALVGETLASLGASRAELAVEAAWQRIRASLGVGK